MSQNEANKIFDKITNQMTFFTLWETGLKDELKNKYDKKQNIFIINKDWIDEYKKTIFNNENKKNEDLIELYKNFKLIDNQLPNVSSVKDLKSVFPLNEESWKSFIKDKKKKSQICMKEYLGIIY